MLSILSSARSSLDMLSKFPPYFPLQQGQYLQSCLLLFCGGKNYFWLQCSSWFILAFDILVCSGVMKILLYQMKRQPTLSFCLDNSQDAFSLDIREQKITVCSISLMPVEWLQSTRIHPTCSRKGWRETVESWNVVRKWYEFSSWMDSQSIWCLGKGGPSIRIFTYFSLLFTMCYICMY